jgi:endonuclease/exonuclease/phosphatase (EEP) superfamily protein YafD
VLGVVARSGTTVAVALVAIVVNAAALVPVYAVGQAAPTPGERLRVAHINMQGRDGDLGALERTLRERRPDVLVVLEPSVQWRIELPDRRVGSYRVYSDVDSTGVLVFAAVPLTRLRQPKAPGLPSTALVFDVHLAGEPVRILALHALSPLTPGRMSERDAALAAAGRWASSHAGPEVIMGDFNATPWSGAVGRLESAGHLRNSADGRGIQATWPALAGPFGLPIDELLYSPELTTTERDTGPTFGSTHRSLWVTVARAAPG